MNHVEKAVEYYNNNFNCSQGVFTSFATEMGMDEKLALKLATNFGGGERKGELCGAVAGALMVLGLRCGHCDSEDIEGKSKAYAVSTEFMEQTGPNRQIFSNCQFFRQKNQNNEV